MSSDAEVERALRFGEKLADNTYNFKISFLIDKYEARMANDVNPDPANAVNDLVDLITDLNRLIERD